MSERGCNLYLTFLQKAEFYFYVSGFRFINVMIVVVKAFVCQQWLVAERTLCGNGTNPALSLP